MYSNSRFSNSSMSKSIDIEFFYLIYEVQNGFRDSKKQILKGINGFFKSGEMTAIMGLSGAGKSTLLNILTGFKQDKSLKGKINYINNERNNITWNEHKKYSCYISQNDHLPNLFTVNEAMTISANLKIDRNLNRKAKQILIDEILDTLDLTKTKNTRTNELSGGQKKRLSIALELVTNPSVMYLDEPTTGLDSYFSLQCVKMLQKLAKGSRTIICTIHQPSALIFEMFDHLYLLADGRCMYEGAPQSIVQYFANLDLHCPKYYNPADYMIEIVNNEYGNFSDQLVAAIECNKAVWRANSSEKSATIVEDKDTPDYNEEEKRTLWIKAPSEFKKFLILLDRYFVQFHRNWTILYLKLYIYFLVGIFLGLFFKDANVDCHKIIKNIKYLVIVTIFLSYTNIMPAISKISSDLAILKKEQFNNWYQLRTYYLALLIANMPVQLFCTLTFSSISYFLSNQPFEWNRFFMFFGIAILTNFIADSLGFIIGILLNPVNGIFTSSVIIGIFLLFEGGIILFNHMPKYLYYFSYFNYFKYSFEGLIQSIYGYNREKLNISIDLAYCLSQSPQIVFRELEMEDDKYWLNLLILITFFIFYRIVGYYVLKRNLLLM
uniref:ABC transporter domain-containing protein n=2 Tax=Vespula pensylvanica TaxID=30213 RepID=A0A834KCX8_VESPE|nr:hypothetical protein H0235_015160 [Vespula pensylvanica]